MNTIDNYNEFCAAQRVTPPTRVFDGISNVVVTHVFHGEEREYSVTADVSLSGQVDLWEGGLSLDELAAALDIDPGLVLDAIRCAALEGSL